MYPRLHLVSALTTPFLEMARDQSLLSSTNPISIAPGNPFIAHVYAFYTFIIIEIDIFLDSQLRDLLICPREQGVVNYVSDRAIIEQDLHAPGAVSIFDIALR